MLVTFFLLQHVIGDQPKQVDSKSRIIQQFKLSCFITIYRRTLHISVKILALFINNDIYGNVCINKKDFIHIIELPKTHASLMLVMHSWSKGRLVAHASVILVRHCQAKIDALLILGINYINQNPKSCQVYIEVRMIICILFFSNHITIGSSNHNCQNTGQYVLKFRLKLQICFKIPVLSHK